MTGAAVEFDGVWKAYGGYVALADISRAWAPEAVHAIVGANGAGKSTLCKILYGEIRADGGAVRLDGEAVDFHSPTDAREAGVAAVHQSPTLVGALSGAANLLLGSETPILKRRERIREARRILDDLDLDVDPSVPVDRLTQYERKLLEIARTAFLRSRVVIFDEPTAGLGPRQREHVLRLVGRLRDAGTTVFYVSHNFEDVASICDTVTVLRDGELVHRQDEAVESGAALERLVFDVPVNAVPAAAAAPLASQLALELSDWRLPGYEQPVALDVHAGEIVGVFGLIDSGIDELARTLTGRERPRSGSIRTEAGEWDAGRWSVRSAQRAGIATLPSDRVELGLLTGRPCFENVTAASHQAAAGPILVSRRKEDAHVERVLRGVEAKAAPRDRIEALSGGNQQKVVLARLIERRPQILIAHEPTVGVDVTSRASLRRRLGELAAEGMTIVILSSDWDEVESVARRTLRIADGRIADRTEGSADGRA